jgi:CubicO group peptidase (beta-lactamase class C family)
MKDTTFRPDAGQIRRMVKAYTTDDKALRPASDGCSAQLVFPKKETIYPAAAGGLFSTARDMVRFSQMLAHHGEWKGRRIISRKTFDSVFAVKQTPKNIPNSYTVGSWLYGDWFGHEGAMRTDQRANLKTGHSRVFFIQTENKAGKAFFELKNDWHKACDKVQGTAPTVFKN